MGLFDTASWLATGSMQSPTQCAPHLSTGQWLWSLIAVKEDAAVCSTSWAIIKDYYLIGRKSYINTILHYHNTNYAYKRKLIPIKTWTGPEDSRIPRISIKSSYESGKVVSLTHRTPFPSQMFLVLISVRVGVDPRTTVRPEGLSKC
jgi:hypothetical protein